MPPKKPAAPVPARGTIMHMFTNQPKPKPNPAPQSKAKIPREFITLEERHTTDRVEREVATKLGGGDLIGSWGSLGSQMDGGGDAFEEGDGRRSPRKHDTPEPPAKAPAKPLVKSPRRSLSGKPKSLGKLKAHVNMSVEQPELDEEIAAGRRSPRKHATPVPELQPSRAVPGSLRRTLDAGDDTDEASQSGRRSPRKHAGTPAPGSRSGTPVMNQEEEKRSLKRTASTLSNHPTKTRRTVSPERRSVRFSATPTSAPQTPPRPTTPTQEVQKTPVVVLPAYSEDWHKPIVGPRKKVTESPAKMVKGTSTACERQSTPTSKSNGTASIKAKTTAQNGVVKRTTRSRTGTPNRVTPPKTKAKESSSFLLTLAESPSPPLKKTPTPKKGSFSFLMPLEDTPSPPPNFATKPTTTNSSFATNGKSSQSRIVVEDTDAESSDSDESMMDLQTLLRNNARPSNSPPSPKKSSKKVTTKSRLPVAASPGKAKRLFGLKAMVAQMEESNRTDESAKRVKKMMADEECASANPSNGASGTVTPHDRHAKLLEDAVKGKAADGGKDAQKIFKVMKRTSPIEGAEMVYQFFKTGTDKKAHKPKEFPSRFLEKAGPKGIWHKMFGDRKNRESCMQDNFFAEMVAMDGKMSDEMFLWVLEQTAKVQDATFCHRYMEMLLNAPITMKELMAPEIVAAHFRLLDAKKEAVILDKKMELEPIQDNPHPGRTKGDHWGELESFLRLLGHAASMISPPTREAALGMILRLCADKLVRTHITLQEAVQLALFKLSESFTEEEWNAASTRISKQLYDTIPTPQILLAIFSTIPSRPRLHNFRRRLAYAFFLRTPSLLSQPIHESFTIDKLGKELDKEEFLMNRDAPDRAYSNLDAHIQLLDIALDSGSSVTAPRLGERHLYAHLASLGTPPPRPKLSQEEVEREERFNQEIDTLSYRLKVILNRIQDLGPGHAKRSNCRTTLQSLGQRIEMTVRTRIKPRDSNFVMPEQVRLRKVEREQERGKKFLRKFLRKGGGDGGQEGKAPGGVVGGGDEMEKEVSELSDAPESEVEEGDSVLDAQAEAQLLLARYV